MQATEKLGVADCVRDFGVPEPAEWQRIGDQIHAVFITARAYFVNVRAVYCTILTPEPLEDIDFALSPSRDSFPTDLRIIADGIMAGSFASRQSEIL
jgi:hypothetical protein